MTATLANPTHHRLTAAESAAYARDGYHIQRGLLSQSDVREVLDAFTNLAKNGPIDGLSNVPPQTAATDPLAKFPRMMHPHIHPEHSETCRLALRWLLDRHIESILRDLMGEQPVAAQSMFYFKPPGSRGQDFHQDNFYLGVAPTTCMAAWIALDAADPDNGGLMVARGSHRSPTLTPTPADMSVSMAPEHVEIPAGCDVVAPDLGSGDVLFFNGQLVHGSKPNTSANRFRRSLICHYLPSSSTEIGVAYHLALVGFDGKPASFAAPAGEKRTSAH